MEPLQIIHQNCIYADFKVRGTGGSYYECVRLSHSCENIFCLLHMCRTLSPSLLTRSSLDCLSSTVTADWVLNVQSQTGGEIVERDIVNGLHICSTFLTSGHSMHIIIIATTFLIHSHSHTDGLVKHARQQCVRVRVRVRVCVCVCEN